MSQCLALASQCLTKQWCDTGLSAHNSSEIFLFCSVLSEICYSSTKNSHVLQNR